MVQDQRMSSRQPAREGRRKERELRVGIGPLWEYNTYCRGPCCSQGYIPARFTVSLAIYVASVSISTACHWTHTLVESTLFPPHFTEMRWNQRGIDVELTSVPSGISTHLFFKARRREECIIYYWIWKTKWMTLNYKHSFYLYLCIILLRIWTFSWDVYMR